MKMRKFNSSVADKKQETTNITTDVDDETDTKETVKDWNVMLTDYGAAPVGIALRKPGLRSKRQIFLLFTVANQLINSYQIEVLCDS